ACEGVVPVEHLSQPQQWIVEVGLEHVLEEPVLDLLGPNSSAAGKFVVNPPPADRLVHLGIEGQPRVSRKKLFERPLAPAAIDRRRGSGNPSRNTPSDSAAKAAETSGHAAPNAANAATDPSLDAAAGLGDGQCPGGQRQLCQGRSTFPVILLKFLSPLG